MTRYQYNLTTLLLFMFCLTVGRYLLTYDYYFNDTQPHVETVLAKDPTVVRDAVMKKEAERITTTSIHCLAVMVYGEARGELNRGKIAVAYTAMSRMKESSASMCDTVMRSNAKGVHSYSIFNYRSYRTAALDASKEPPIPTELDRKAWIRCKNIAKLVWAGKVEDPTYGATFYWSPELAAKLGLSRPTWADQYAHVATIGSHEFYSDSI